MGKRIAILAGCSNYQNENDLPPCEFDLQIVDMIIDSTKAFHEKILVGGNPKSGEFKDQVSAFIRKYQGEDVAEVVFYFTGHGKSIKDDFLFLFSDYDSSKPEQTSLRNSELDSMLKSLNPSLTVKIVDACQSGTQYLKGEKDLEELLAKSTKSSFKHVYFLFSSSSVEASFAKLNGSYFTRSFAESIYRYSGKEIRYRDVMAYISDDQTVASHQTPLFIQQANNTEVFCTISEELRLGISSKLGISSSQSETQKRTESEVEPPTLAESQDLVKVVFKASEEICSEIEAKESLAFFYEEVSSFNWGETLSQLFSFETKVDSDLREVTGVEEIAEWLKQRKNSFFADVLYKEEEYQANKKVEIEELPGGAAFAAFGDMFPRKKRIEYEPVTKYRQVPYSIRPTTSFPNCLVMISLTPKAAALQSHLVFIVFVFSKKDLAVFVKREKEVERSWEYRNPENKCKWKKFICLLKNREEIRNTVMKFLLEQKESLEQEIVKRFTNKYTTISEGENN